jgi:hypothetical protein
MNRSVNNRIIFVRRQGQRWPCLFISICWALGFWARVSSSAMFIENAEAEKALKCFPFVAFRSVIYTRGRAEMALSLLFKGNGFHADI